MLVASDLIISQSADSKKMDQGITPFYSLNIEMTPVRPAHLLSASSQSLALSNTNRGWKIRFPAGHPCIQQILKSSLGKLFGEKNRFCWSTRSLYGTMLKRHEDSVLMREKPFEKCVVYP